VDVGSGKTLYAHEPAKTWIPASLTKLSMASTFTASPTKWDARGVILKQDEVGGGRLAVPSGARMTLRDLMYSAIVGSANNAAEALGRMDGPGKEGFIKKMNTRMPSIGASNSVFYDASGMSAANKTTAYDMMNIFLSAHRDAEVRKAMMTASYQFTVAVKPPLAKNVKNTNLLVTSDAAVTVTGGKTGYLPESGYNFALSAKPGAGQPATAGEVMVMVFGAPSRDASQQAAATLSKWSWNAFDWQAPSSTRVLLARNLGKGDKGADVNALQQFLNTHGAVITTSGAGSPGRETELFGTLTQDALKRYQQTHAAAVLAPQGIATASGYLDVVTRAYINASL
jgi:serine-type D-Ala-D-Ala endopeptidase (penicillin-binding protein 7)